MMQVVSVILYLLLAPLAGALLDGVDRKISARMQGRQGPPLLQPFYDLGKLFTKQMLAVNSVQIFLLLSYLIFLAVSGSLLFAGADILMCLFILSTADMFLVMAASSDSSPFSTLGAGREMIQIMAYEPMTLLLAVGFYLATGSFQVADIISQPVSAVATMPGFLLGMMFTMAIKLRKSPFDLSTSHHAHQEIVKGLTTEMAGPALAVMNIAEYYEMTLMLGLVALFFLNSNPISWPVAIAACLLVYFLEILWDNVSARVKWKALLDSCWVFTLLTGGLNGLILIKSPWLLHYDGSSCNGCDIEVLACTTPKYDIERFGIINTGDPFQADILLITGGVNHQSESVIQQIYTQMPEPKVVVAVGICACTGGVFKDCYNIKGGVDTIIPVDVYVPGCAARPQAIIDGVVQALEILQRKREDYAARRRSGRA